MRIVLAQINPTVGDLAGNAARIQNVMSAHADADLIVFPELALSGYPPEDLVLRPSFLARTAETLAGLAADGPALVVGAPDEGDTLSTNSLHVFDGGQMIHRQAKHVLPTYGVFDEARTFAPGPLPEPVTVRGVPLGFLICEDLWQPEVAARLKARGAKALICLNASPYESGKPARRLAVARARARETGLPVLYVNQVGGQDELVFDGGSFAVDGVGALTAQAPSWREAALVLTLADGAARGEITPAPDDLAADYHALVLGVRDYAGKNRFSGAVLGLSGGIDSALTLAVAVDALGAENVRVLLLPSPYTAPMSVEDARAQADAQGVRHDTVPIAPMMEAYGQALAPLFTGREADVTEENLQSRIRGALLMAVSNKFGLLLLSTGNKSELATGYATLYGDMCGGFAVLKDVYKTHVYALARWRNAQGAVIPERVLTRAPSAELKPDQTDQDTLPPYDVLDAILHGLIEEQTDVDTLVARGFERATIARVARMLYAAEFKRRQGAPGVKLTRRAFGRERRYPITSAWRG